MASSPPKIRRAIFIGIALLALVVRLPRLGERPMHTDEAVNAYIIGQLLGGEAFQYDPRDRHGPALYALALPLARAAGQKQFVALTESTLRLGPVLVGVATILLLAGLAKPLGLLAATGAALLVAIGPLPVYYNRYFIHETLFVAATLGLIVFGWRAASRGSMAAAALAGLCSGLMLAGKETALLHFAALGVACLPCVLCRRHAENDAGTQPPVRWSGLAKTGAVALAAFLFVLIALYTWGGRHWQGLLDLAHSIPRFTARAAGEGHEKPVWYYLALLGNGWSGAAVLSLAALGGVGIALSSRRRSSRDPHPQTSRANEDEAAGNGRRKKFAGFLLIYTLAIGIIYSAIPYKTPWLALNLWLPLSLLAGCGCAVLWRAAHATAARSLLLLAGGVLAALLARDTWQRAIARPSDERNPYAYAHTVEDLLRLPDRVGEVAQRGGPEFRIAVIAADPWPLPWYLRHFQQVGFWQPGQDPGAAEVYITTPEAAEALASRLQNRRPEFFGLRPEVLVTVWVPLEAEVRHE